MGRGEVLCTGGRVRSDIRSGMYMPMLATYFYMAGSRA